MPPKVRISKEDIIQTTVDIIRKHGEQGINARVIAKELDCSTQPIFSNFSSMEELRFAVLDAANSIYRRFTENVIKSNKYPIYKATGMAYIRFAREEKELFKLLFMRDRTCESISVESDGFNEIVQLVHESAGVSADKAEIFHLEMWAFVHGFATMIATDYLTLEDDLISELLTDAYLGLQKRYRDKE